MRFWGSWMIAAWTRFELEGHVKDLGPSFVNETLRPEEVEWLVKNTQLTNVRSAFQTHRASFYFFWSWNLVLLCFRHCWQNNLRKCKKGPKLGEDLSWFAPSSPTSLGYQLRDELCMNMNHPGISWDSFYVVPSWIHPQWVLVSQLPLAQAIHWIEGRVRVEAENKCQQQKLYHMFSH